MNKRESEINMICEKYIAGEETGSTSMEAIIATYAAYPPVHTIEVTFAKRTEEQVKAKLAASHPDVPKVETVLDFSDLSEAEVLEWAKRGVVISLQSKLDSGSVKLDDLRGSVKVPKPGDRKRVSEADKVRRLVAALLGKDVEDVTDEECLTALQKVMGK